MHIIGAMLQSETLNELGAILRSVTVLCTTSYEKHGREHFDILKGFIEDRPGAKEICHEKVSLFKCFSDMFLCTVESKFF